MALFSLRKSATGSTVRGADTLRGVASVSGSAAFTVLAVARPFTVVAMPLSSGNPIQTNPATVTEATVEDIVWGFDTSVLVGAQAPTLVNSKLTNLSTNAVIVLADTPSISANIINQRVRGSVLAANTNYRLEVSFTVSGSTNLLEMALQINCPW